MLTVGEHLMGGSQPEAFKMCSLFAGGVGGCREEMCGALSAGVIILGALYGRSALTDDEQRAKQQAAEWRERFVSHFGATRCASIREEHATLEDGCAPVVQQAAALFLELFST